MRQTTMVKVIRINRGGDHMTKEQAQQMLDELNEARLDKPFEGNAKSLFEAIMKIADERDELKKKVKARNIGINSLMQSRKKWKNRYYKIRKQLKQKYDRDTHILQNQLDLANAENIKKDKQIEKYQNMLVTNDMLHIKESQEKDKIIDLMAEQLTTPINSKEWVKEYYKKITKEL